MALSQDFLEICQNDLNISNSIKIHSPGERSTVAFLLFGSGKIICIGKRSIDDAEKAFARTDKRLKNLNE
jgi:hypothetical protein